MLFLYYVLLYFSLSITSAAAPTNDPSQPQRDDTKEHGSSSQPSKGQFKLNPHAAAFHPAPPKVADGTNPQHNPYLLKYMDADITKMKKAEELGLNPGQLYNVRKYVLGLQGGSDHNTVPVVYNGPVPDYGGKLAFVSLVWKDGKSINFPEQYTENAMPCFNNPVKIISEKSIMITKYTYIVWAGSLMKVNAYDGITLTDPALTRIQDYMVNDYRKNKPHLVTNRMDLGQTPLSKVK